ncbi:hypothetical protein [Sporichthya sp.]|uniref:hypothetical protein n=1 Tax=Sporichthya sp. TaxID=65475 RepID=UPI0018483A86|nr:hypothetical protein [Sporichthya sp.]MBA3745573.1 hypothetical protein [Sporichthya sp.]
MTRLRLRAASAAAALVLTGGLLGACSGGDNDIDDPAAGTSGAPVDGVPGVDPTTTTPGAAGGAAAGAADTKVVPGDSLYVLLKLAGWQLGEAVRPIGKSRPQYQQLDKSLDWYATYDQPATDQSVQLNGHLRGLSGQSTVLRKDGAGKLKTGEINGRAASWLDQRGGNVIVLIALARNYTLELVVSGADLETTLKIARALTPVDQTKWKAAGGKVLDCLAAGAECIGT